MLFATTKSRNTIYICDIVLCSRGNSICIDHYIQFYEDTLLEHTPYFESFRKCYTYDLHRKSTTTVKKPTTFATKVGYELGLKQIVMIMSIRSFW